MLMIGDSEVFRSVRSISSQTAKRAPPITAKVTGSTSILAGAARRRAIGTAPTETYWSAAARAHSRGDSGGIQDSGASEVRGAPLVLWFVELPAAPSPTGND